MTAEPSSPRARPSIGPVAVAVAILTGLLLMVPIVVGRLAPDSSASMADAEQIGTNRLGAATMGLALSTSAGELSTTEGVVFSAGNLVPGDVVTGMLKVGNTGDLPVDFQVAIQADDSVLIDWLALEIWNGGSTGADGELCAVDDPARSAARPVVPLRGEPETVGVASAAATQAAPGPVLDPSVWATVCLAATLPLEAPNEVQGQRADLTVVVTAQQVVEGGT